MSGRRKNYPLRVTGEQKLDSEIDVDLFARALLRSAEAILDRCHGIVAETDMELARRESEERKRRDD